MLHPLVKVFAVLSWEWGILFSQKGHYCGCRMPYAVRNKPCLFTVNVEWRRSSVCTFIDGPSDSARFRKLQSKQIQYRFFLLKSTYSDTLL